MKKIYCVVIILLVTLVVTGCFAAGRKKLVCKQNANGVDVTFNIDFNGNTIEKMYFSYDVDMTSRDQTAIDLISKQDFCTIVKNSMKEYTTSFANCNQNVDNKHLIVNAELDVDKLAGNAINKKTSPKAAKSELEKQQYTCSFE